MRLNKIKLAGFKSFVDPTTVNFPSNLMGVVGPNGCGKSNIIDAIRWVLGESSAKTLRGDSMADVIFNGSGGRKPVGQASIELIFDNTDGTVSGAYASYAEIAVRRVVTRDGISQYFLNNTRCRRKDITQILLGTGLGSHGYSIIEQGMISRLVEAKPEDLRAFLEEAAGISKYKERRRETEHRIRHTRENLERIADLREEIDKQLSHLQRQAKAAEKYKGLKTEERQLTAELLALRLQSLAKSSDTKSQVLRERQLATDAAVAEKAHVDAEIEKSRVLQSDTTEKFNGVQGDYYRVGAEIARLEQSIKHRRETLARQTDDLTATDAQLAELWGHIQSDEVELKALDSSLSALSPDYERAVADREQAERQLEAATRAMDEWRESRDALAAARAELDRTAHVESSRLEQYAAQAMRLTADIEAHDKELSSLSPADIESRLSNLVGHEEKLRVACDEAKRGLESVVRQISQLRDQERKVTDRLDEVRESLQNDKGRLASLEALQEAAMGRLSKQVDQWLASRSLDQNTRLAQILEVESGWERAVEVALGHHLQALAVDTVSNLAEDLARITDGSLSLVETGSGNSNNSANDNPIGTPLAAHVKAPASAAVLMHGIYAVDGVEDALRIRDRLADGESVITRSGLWIGRSFIRVSGRDDPRHGVIGRTDEIERLREVVVADSRRADEVAKALADTRTRLEQLEEIRDNTQTESNRRQQLFGEVTTRLRASRTELEQTQTRARDLDQKITDCRAAETGLNNDIATSQSQLDESLQRAEALQIDSDGLEKAHAEIVENLDKARAAAEKQRADAQEIAIKVESRRSSKESASAALSRVQTQHTHLEQRRTELLGLLETGKSPLESDEQALAAQLDRHREVEGLLADARRSVESVETALRDLELQRNEKQQKVESERERAEAARMELREVEVRAETVREQFAETGHDLESLTAGIDPEATIDTWAEQLETNNRRIQRLGAINLAAIDEFQEQSERKTYLDSQFNDLSEALDTLENAIRRIDRETRAKFKETFDKANQGLGELFPRLFGGGQAYLELDSDDLLASGVSIMARPPGKRISTIHLMSGGEKALTAVALVFSIFALNPAPFCLLDEVDAPLDEANVGRFCEILKEMSRRVQFVIITHNKATMESMDQLSGVTMSEPGVSRLVAVDIDEAVQLAAV